MVAVPRFLSSFFGFLASTLGIFRHRLKQSASEQHLDDIGAIMDDNYYKRDIVMAGKKLSASCSVYQQVNAVRDIGHIAWLGGPSIAQFASSHMLEFGRILQDEDAPIQLKNQTLCAIIEICIGSNTNQEKARWSGLLQTLYKLLDYRVSLLRRGATACLAVLINENYANHVLVINMAGIKEKLLRILQGDWRAWKRNEAARLILMLGLNREKEPAQNDGK